MLCVSTALLVMAEIYQFDTGCKQIHHGDYCNVNADLSGVLRNEDLANRHDGKQA